MKELKKNRREVVKGDNSEFPAISNKKITYCTNAQCNLGRKEICKFYCTTTTGLFFNYSECWASGWQEELNLVERCIFVINYTSELVQKWDHVCTANLNNTCKMKDCYCVASWLPGKLCRMLFVTLGSSVMLAVSWVLVGCFLRENKLVTDHIYLKKFSLL